MNRRDLLKSILAAPLLTQLPCIADGSKDFNEIIDNSEFFKEFQKNIEVEYCKQNNCISKKEDVNYKDLRYEYISNYEECSNYTWMRVRVALLDDDSLWQNLVVIEKGDYRKDKEVNLLFDKITNHLLNLDLKDIYNYNGGRKINVGLPERVLTKKDIKKLTRNYEGYIKKWIYKTD